MRFLSLVFSFALSLSSLTQAQQVCTNAYNKMYSDGVLTLSVFYGYSDSEDYVDDHINKANMVTKLTAPCNYTIITELCGFVRDPDDADILTKTITRPNGKQDKVRLRLMSSAVSDSHTKNLGSLKKSQEAQSKKTEEAYFRALETDDVVLYNGHARRGTGPGFRPMTNADWIKAATLRTNYNRMSTVLKNAKHKPSIIGMVTCEGQLQYGKVLQDAAPTSGLLLTRQTISFDEGNALIDASIDNILRKTCPAQFRKEIQETTYYIFNSPLHKNESYRQKLPEIYNFFEVNKKKFVPQPGAITTLINGNAEETSTVEIEKKREDNPSPVKRPAKTSQ